MDITLFADAAITPRRRLSGVWAHIPPRVRSAKSTRRKERERGEERVGGQRTPLFLSYVGLIHSSNRNGVKNVLLARCVRDVILSFLAFLPCIIPSPPPPPADSSIAPSSLNSFAFPFDSPPAFLTLRLQRVPLLQISSLLPSRRCALAYCYRATVVLLPLFPFSSAARGVLFSFLLASSSRLSRAREE